jgi:single-strand DNA-binding protein
MNKVILSGNLGQDPELKTTDGGTVICNFSVATKERVKKDGEWTDHTEWHRIVAFGGQAETTARFCVKGSKVLVEGKLQTRKWEDKEGVQRSTTEIVADSVEFMGAKREDEASGRKEEPRKKPTRSDDW